MHSKVTRYHLHFSRGHPPTTTSPRAGGLSVRGASSIITPAVENNNTQNDVAP